MKIDPVRQQPLWETVAERMRAAIISGEIPPGAKLVESALADQFETSRGPVREAIRELDREGLVVELPRRGTVVSTLSVHDLIEVYDVREALETKACRAVIANASDDDIAALGAPLDALEQASDYMESVEQDLAFHRAVVALSGNSRIAAIYEQMLTQTMVLLRTASEVKTAHRVKARRSAHQDILDALVARDEIQAQTAIEAHYHYAAERLFGALADQR